MSLVIPLFIPHRGCSHQCLFCNQERISGARRDEPGEMTLTHVIDEWLARSPGRTDVQAAFFGGSFTCLPEQEQEEMMAVVQPYIQAGKIDCIRLSTRPDCINPAICRLLKSYNVRVVELGVQSFSDVVLKESRRGHSSDDSRMACALLQESGMQVGLQLMPGLPKETTQSFLAGIDEVVALRPDFVRLYPVLVVKDSGLAQRYREHQYRPLSMNKAIALTARAYTKLHAAGIKVVRMGLQRSPSLIESLVAGPFHPAFGELVMARTWLRKIRTRLVDLKDGERLEIHISPRDLSAVNGMRRSNIRRLEALGLGERLTIILDQNMVRGSIRYVVC